jgi:NIPSNAP
MWHHRVPQGAFERLELLEGKLSRAVLRGLSGSNPARLPGDEETCQKQRALSLPNGQIPKVLEAWAKAIPDREKFSPLAACWYSELGGLNKFVHTWVYKDLNERARVREEARTSGGAWPPQAGVRPIRQENKLLVPAAFSPVR